MARFSNQREAEADEPATVSMMACLGGRLSDAYRLGGVALQQAREHRGPRDRFNLDARSAMAEVLFEHDELDLAEAELEAALSISFAEGVTHSTWRVEIDLVRVHDRPAAPA